MTKNGATATTMSNDAIYTHEQLQAVQKINRTKDLYKILDVSKDCTEDELKRAYKKLALKLHPDKNHAPGATEAFKNVNKAFSILSDSNERTKYEDDDLHDEDVIYAHDIFSDNTHHFDEHFDYKDFYFTEEMFNIFFERRYFHPNSETYNNYSQRPHKPKQKQHSTRRQQQQQQQQTKYQKSESTTRRKTNGHDFLGSYSLFVQMSPLLFMALLCLVNTMLSYDEVYSLHKDSKYVVEKFTSRLNIPFYTKDQYKEKYSGHLVEIEKQIEDNFIINLKNKCFQEKSRREYILWRARMYNNPALFEQNKDKKLPSCDQLQNIVSSY